MRLQVLTFAEYAAVSADGKLTIAGTIDGISFRRTPGVVDGEVPAVPLPSVYLVAVIEGSISDGLKHALALRILDEDQQVVTGLTDLGEFHFHVNRYGRPVRAQIIVRLQGLAVPHPGDFEFELFVDGTCHGVAPFYVTDETPDEG